jgi:hypothetical protein
MKPTWCSFHSFYWESRASKCFEHYLLILRGATQTTLSILRACNVIRLCHYCTQYTKCRLCKTSWGWASNAWNI